MNDERATPTAANPTRERRITLLYLLAFLALLLACLWITPARADSFPIPYPAFINEAFGQLDAVVVPCPDQMQADPDGQWICGLLQHPLDLARLEVDLAAMTVGAEPLGPWSSLGEPNTAARNFAHRGELYTVGLNPAMGYALILLLY